MPLREKLEAALQSVYEAILAMGTRTEEALHKALTALSSHDVELAATVIDEDRHIDAMQTEIDNQVARVLATEQPVAEDLRRLITCIKLVTEVERIGDHARHIAAVVKNTSRPLVELTLPSLEKMCSIGTGMLHDVLTALMERDTSQAAEIAARDDRIDELHKTTVQEIIAYMRQHPEEVADGAVLLQVCRYLERLGDHVTNMCEWIVYAQRGERVELNP